MTWNRPLVHKLSSTMCGRIALHTPPSRLARLLDARLDPEVEGRCEPSWNVAPTTDVLAVVEDPPRPDEQGPDKQGPTRLLTPFRWGLVPYWAKDPRIGNRMINARAETLSEKAPFRQLLSRHRCLVLADGFFEWQVDPIGPEGHARRRLTPFYFRRSDGLPLALAGLWDRWRVTDRPDGKEELLRTCTIVTTEAGPDVAPVHSRMPVVVEKRDVDCWLDRTLEDLAAVTALLEPSPAGVLVSHEVGRRVNDVRQDGPDLIEPLGQDPGRQGPGHQDPDAHPPERQPSLF